MLIEQIIEVESRVPGLLVVHIPKTGYFQGWKYRLVIDNRCYILCFSVTDYRRCFAFNLFYRLLPLLCFSLTCYRLVKTLNFTFVLVESA